MIGALHPSVYSSLAVERKKKEEIFIAQLVT